MKNPRAWVYNEIHAKNDLPGVSNDSGLKSPCIQKPVQTKNAASTVASIMPQHDERCVSLSAKSGKGESDTILNPFNCALANYLKKLFTSILSSKTWTQLYRRIQLPECPLDTNTRASGWGACCSEGLPGNNVGRRTL